MSEHGKRQYIADGDPAPIAKCGSTIPHGAHGPSWGGPAWCAGNQNIVRAVIAPSATAPHTCSRGRMLNPTPADWCEACLWMAERQRRIEETGE